ncbi:MAG TPA: maleylpyruvate isomerase family mycothiol-dependent enzyme [Trebonia sp.]|nr:maleylpyruvate isomerase family mycothiol-dependent enzyme [Trebonia sp.]
MTDAVIDDYAAETARLEGILGLLTEEQWRTESGASGWSVADVVLHLAQSEEAVVASASGSSPRAATAAAGTVDDWAARMVDAERAEAAQVFTRWRRARDAAVEALRAADPQVALQWVTGLVKPGTLATTRLAEHWAHGLDITGPLGIDFPDTSRLRHIAWLAHRTLPYAFSLAGEEPAAVRCLLTAPDGVTAWTFGRDDAESEISGPAGVFCRVAAQRLDPAASGLQATGTHGAAALRVLRTYA